MRKSKKPTPPFAIPENAIPDDLLAIGFTATFLSSIKKSPITNIQELERITVPLNDQGVINNIVGLVKETVGNPKPLFTSKNISSIFHGMGGGNLSEAAEALFLSKDEIFTLMKPKNEGGLGFTSTNISSILSGAGENLSEAVDALSVSKDKIAELMKPKEDGGLGFTPTNISSILNRVGKDAEKAVEFLFSNKDDIRDLIKPIDEGGFNFNSQNIASMLSRSGAKMEKVVNELLTIKDKIAELMKPTNEGGLGFTSANISSILNGAGNNLGQAVQALSASKDRIAELMKPTNEGGLGFTSVNISSILCGAGNNVGQAVEALLASKDGIAELMKSKEDGGLGFTINQIKIKLFGVKSSFDLNNAEIEEFESEELLHRPSSKVSQLGKRRRDRSSSFSEPQVRDGRQRLLTGPQIEDGSGGGERIETSFSSSPAGSELELELEQERGHSPILNFLFSAGGVPNPLSSAEASRPQDGRGPR